MRFYGSVKGWIYRNEQKTVEPRNSHVKSICPVCRKPKPERDYWKGNIRCKRCLDCRRIAAQAESRYKEKKREQ